MSFATAISICSVPATFAVAYSAALAYYRTSALPSVAHLYRLYTMTLKSFNLVRSDPLEREMATVMYFAAFERMPAFRYAFNPAL
jgi:hypothetical protein